MNQRQLEVQKLSVQDEKRIIRQLQQVYKKASEDCQAKIEALAARQDLQNIQTIIYQQQYQKALKKQLDSIFDELQASSFQSISDYLEKCYENGFFGTLYDLQGQGIPLIIPIDQRQVVQALELDAKLSKPFYDRLGEDVTFLKKKVKAEVSRGIANGSTWWDVAQKIATGMNSPLKTALYNSMRIARTEGHRIQNQAQWDTINKAKAKGADIVKQWDSTLDQRTRATHRRLDGQIRELDEPFEVDGHKAMYPGGFGIPKEDIHCRCVMLQRTRWALDEEELEILKDRAAYFELDKTKDFEDYKSKYLKAVQQVQVQSGHPDCPIAKAYGSDYYDALHQLVADCPDKTAASVWDKYEEQVQVGNPNYKGRAYAQAGKIYVGKDISAKGSNYQTPYQVTVHESGHAIDYLTRKTGSGQGYFFSSTYKNGAFPTTIKDEVSKWVSSVDKKMKADFKAHKTDYAWLNSNGYISDWEYDFWKRNGTWIGGEPSYSKAIAYESVQTEIRGIPLIDRGNLSDIVEGATKGRVKGGVGHGDSYWKGAGGTENLATEAFAEMLDATIANPGSLEQIKKYLPDSYKVFQDMLAELLK